MSPRRSRHQTKTSRGRFERRGRPSKHPLDTQQVVDNVTRLLKDSDDLEAINAGFKTLARVVVAELYLDLFTKEQIAALYDEAKTQGLDDSNLRKTLHPVLGEYGIVNKVKTIERDSAMATGNSGLERREEQFTHLWARRVRKAREAAPATPLPEPRSFSLPMPSPHRPAPLDRPWYSKEAWLVARFVALRHFEELFV